MDTTSLPGSVEAKPSTGATQLAAGERYEMVLTVPFNESNGVSHGTLTLETNQGTVTCSAERFGEKYSSIEGTDETNDQAADTVELTKPAGSLNNEEECTSSTGLGGHADVSVEPYGAILNLSGAKGKVDLKAKSSAPPILAQILYSGGDRCIYTATNLKGSLKLEPWGGLEQLSVIFEQQKLKLDKSVSVAECSKKVMLSAPFEYQDQGSGYGPGFGEGYYVFGHLA